MAGRGPAPKGTASRARDQHRRHDAQVVHLVPDGEAHGPDLPDTHEWPPATLAWWDTWRSSPQAQAFTDTDWSFLLDTAVLHAEFWLGDRSLASELRLRAAKFGATPEDRARLKISIGEPDAKNLAERKPAQAKRRERLLKAVGDDA